MSDKDVNDTIPEDQGVFGQGFAAMFDGSPHGGDTPPAVEPIPVEVPGKTDAKAEAKTEADKPEPKAEAEAKEPKPDAEGKPSAPPGVIAERRRAQAAERHNAELSERLSRQEQVMGELLSHLQRRQAPPDFVTDPERATAQLTQQIEGRLRAEFQQQQQQAEQARYVQAVHQTANASQNAAAEKHGEDVVVAALEWAKATGRAGPQSPYASSQDPYGDLVSDFTGAFRAQSALQSKLLGIPMQSQQAASAKTAASQVRIPPSLAGATPAGSAAAKTVQDNDSWFSDMLRTG